MKTYIQQLLSDIKFATENKSVHWIKKESYDWQDVVPEDEEERTAPIRDLEEWTGIKQEQLPPHEMLNDDQVSQLFNALNEMLNEYNWMFVTQIHVPERIQYATIRDNFKQDAMVKQWSMGFFEFCKKGTEHKKCAMGEYCHCAFYAELFKDMVDEDLTPEEERAMELRCELQHIKRKYGDDYMKYYPYHLDPEYDDEDGNPHDYGFGDGEEEDDEDNWWRK